MTVSLLTLAIVLTVNVFVNSVLYITALKDEHLCIILASMSAVASGNYFLLTSKSVLRYGHNLHSVIKETTGPLATKASSQRIIESYTNAIHSSFLLFLLEF